MAVAGGREAVVGVGIGAVQRDRGRSQCRRATSSPKAAIARAPTDPTICSSRGAIASNARPIRSSLSTCGSIPQTSSTAHCLAQSSTRSSGWTGQPVGDQRLDHLPMGHPRHLLAHRAGTIDDPGHIQPPAQLAHHRQRAQQLLHTGRRVGVADRTQAGRRAAHPQNLPQPPAGNTTTNTHPPLPHAMCERQG